MDFHLFDEYLWSAILGKIFVVLDLTLNDVGYAVHVSILTVSSPCSLHRDFFQVLSLALL